MATSMNFDPTDPNETVTVHSPDGKKVAVTRQNAYDLVRLNGYFWSAADATAAEATAAAALEAENEEPETVDETPTEVIVETAKDATAAPATMRNKRPKKSAGK